jgi:hypothetical protein
LLLSQVVWYSVLLKDTMASLMSKTVAELTGSELIQILKDFIVSAPPQMTKTKGGKAKKVKKEKDPDAPKKEVSEGVRLWNEEVAEVLEEMKASGWTHPETGKPVSRKDAMAEASKRKGANDPEYAAKADIRRQKREEQLGKKENRKNSDASHHSEAAAEATAKAEDKPKKVLSPEHKAKLLAAAALAREKKKAEKDGSAPSPPSPSAPAPAPVSAPVPEAKAKKAAKAVPVPVPAPVPAPVAEAEEDAEEWIRKSIGGKKHLWNPANNQCYHCETDGSQGAWAGLYNPKTQKIDTSAPEPEDE